MVEELDLVLAMIMLVGVVRMVSALYEVIVVVGAACVVVVD